MDMPPLRGSLDPSGSAFVGAPKARQIHSLGRQPQGHRTEEKRPAAKRRQTKMTAAGFRPDVERLDQLVPLRNFLPRFELAHVEQSGLG
jgi:hypothetical protein